MIVDSFEPEVNYIEETVLEGDQPPDEDIQEEIIPETNVGAGETGAAMSTNTNIQNNQRDEP